MTVKSKLHILSVMNEQVHKVNEGRRKNNLMSLIVYLVLRMLDLKQLKVTYRLCPSLSKCAQVNTPASGVKSNHSLLIKHLVLEC